MANLETVTIRFNTPIRHHELPLLRGAIISALPHDSVLFHNHVGDRLRYGYPLIQYKCIDGKAALFSVGKGMESVWDFFSGNQFELRLGHRIVHLTVENMQDNITPIACNDDMAYHYTINEWLPLNRDNYQRYSDEESLAGRVNLLDRILTGNILSMLTGVDVRLTEKLCVSITDVSAPKPLHFKGVQLISFRIAFSSNLQLPEYIGLGRHVSIGFGTVESKQKSKNI